MTRILAIALLAAVMAWVSPGTARAADGATFQPLGFSTNASHFAFMQFGVQDGSGFPYADVFVIDLARNEWVKGSPIRILREDESGDVGAVASEAIAKATPLLKTLNISIPATILAANPATEAVADRSRIMFDRWYRSMGAGPPGDTANNEVRHELSVEAFKLAVPANCPADDVDFFGFTLRHTSFKSGATEVLHTDTKIPASRNCPVGYDISAVVAPAGFSHNGWIVAIIGVYAMGFEGANQRFLAVPFNPG